MCSVLLSVFENILAFKNTQNSWVAKSLLSHTFAVKNQVFEHASHKMHLTIGLKFYDKILSFKALIIHS